MDTNEKLGLIERVDHASGHQAKRALKSMILKCTVRHGTIARAIKDAVGRHTPTPVIVYQHSESEDDEASLTSSHRNPNEEKKDQDSSSQDEQGMPPATSRKHPRTRRGHIKPGPLIEQPMLTKTKKKLKGKNKRAGDHDLGLNSPAPSKRKKSKHASRLRAENEKSTSKTSMGKPDDKKKPTVIDLISSTNDDTCVDEQSEVKALENNSSDDGNSDNGSSDDGISHGHSSDNHIPSHDSSHDENSDDKTSETENFADGLASFKLGLDKNDTRASPSNGFDSRNSAQWSTHARAKASTHNVGVEMSPTDLNKKRKESERAVEGVHNDQTAKSATVVHLNKRSKLNHPSKSQVSPEDRKCPKCYLKFPSVAQLLRHRLYCKDTNATSGSHHRSEPSSHNHPRRAQQVQKDSHPAGDSFIDEPHSTLQLPSRPLQRAPGARELSARPPSFVHEPNNFPRGRHRLLTFARQPPEVDSLPQGTIRRPGPMSSSGGPSDHKSLLSERESPRQHPFQEPRVKPVHQCRFCKEWFRDSENSKGACNCHTGMCRSPHY